MNYNFLSQIFHVINLYSYIVLLQMYTLQYYFEQVNDRTGEAGNNNTISSTAMSVVATTTTSSSPLPTTVVASGSHTSITGVRVVLGTGEDAEQFKVPIAPAPRQAHVQPANFNSQLNVSPCIVLYILLINIYVA